MTSALTSATDFSDVILNVGRIYSNCSSAPIFQSLILRKSEQGSGVQFALYTNALTDDLLLCPKSLPSLKLAFLLKPGISTKYIVEKLLLDIFGGAIPLQYVKRVYLADLAYDVDGKTVATTVGMLPSVRFVMAANCASEPFLNALKLYSHDDEATGPPTSTLYFPRLSSISLRETYINNTIDLAPEVLRDTFIQRYECGAEIEKLTLHDCFRLKEEDVDLLAEVVVDVDWDGEELFSEEEEEDRCHCCDEEYGGDYYDHPFYYGPGSDMSDLDFW